MAIKPRFADQERKASAQFGADGVNGGSDRVESFGFVRYAARYASWAAVFTKDRAHLCGPFPGCHPCFGCGDRRGHDVIAVFGRIAQGGQGRINRGLVTVCTPSSETIDLVLFYGGIDDHDAAFARSQR